MRMPSQRIDPDRTALMLMDFQAGVLASIGDPSEVLANAKTARDLADSAGIHVVYIRVAFGPQDYEAIPRRNKAFSQVAAAKMLADDSSEASIHADLAPRDGDAVITKTRFGSFSTTNLANHLNAHGIDTLILAGVSTGGVVLSTARDAADRDYQIFVLEDCVADAHPEVHRVLLGHVLPMQTDVVKTGDLKGLLAG
jgi:nicotinamidase-related amidase